MGLGRPADRLTHHPLDQLRLSHQRNLMFHHPMLLRLPQLPLLAQLPRRQSVDPMARGMVRLAHKLVRIEPSMIDIMKRLGSSPGSSISTESSCDLGS